MSPGRTRTMSPGTSSRAGMTCHFRIAPDAGADLQPFPQCLNDTGRSLLLHEAQHRIDNQQRAHHREIREFLEHRRQHHDQFEHPRRNAPEFLEEIRGPGAPFLRPLRCSRAPSGWRPPLRCVSPVSAFTWSVASVSGTEAEAMSGGLPFAGCDGAVLASGFSAVVCIINALLRLRDLRRLACVRRSQSWSDGP